MDHFETIAYILISPSALDDHDDAAIRMSCISLDTNTNTDVMMNVLAYRWMYYTLKL